MLRCARCMQEWQATSAPPPAPPVLPPAASPPVPPLQQTIAPQLAEAPLPVSAPRDSALARLARQLSARLQFAPLLGAPLIGAWVLSFAVLIACGWSAVHWRESVMSVWPPSQRAYQAIGLN